MANVTIKQLQEATTVNPEDLFAIYKDEDTHKLSGEDLLASQLNRVEIDSSEVSEDEQINFFVVGQNTTKKASVQTLSDYTYSQIEDQIQNRTDAVINEWINVPQNVENLKQRVDINDIYSYGKQLQNNSDLNNITTLGQYYNNNIQINLTNSPFENEIPQFKMTVEKLTPITLRQTIKPKDEYSYYVRDMLQSGLKLDDSKNYKTITHYKGEGNKYINKYWLQLLLTDFDTTNYTISTEIGGNNYWNCYDMYQDARDNNLQTQQDKIDLFYKYNTMYVYLYDGALNILDNFLINSITFNNNNSLIISTDHGDITLTITNNESFTSSNINNIKNIQGTMSFTNSNFFSDIYDAIPNEGGGIILVFEKRLLDYNNPYRQWITQETTLGITPKGCYSFEDLNGYTIGTNVAKIFTYQYNAEQDDETIKQIQQTDIVGTEYTNAYFGWQTMPVLSN